MTFDDLLARIRRQPRDVTAAIELADQALTAGREEEALPLLGRAAQAVGANPRLWQWLALLHRALDDRAAALPLLDRAAALAPNDKSILHGRARIAFEVGLPAVALYEAALRTAPDDTDMLLGHAAARLAQGDVAGAETELEALLRRDPSLIAVHGDLVQLRWTMGDRASFGASYEDALRVRPREPALWRALIATLIHAGHHDQALEVIARARRAIPPEPFLEANEAAIHSETGNVAAADAAFARVAAVRDVTLAVRRVRHSLRTGRLHAALREIESWIGTSAMPSIWPYAATAWRLAGDPRRDWLEQPAELVRVIDMADRLPDLGRVRELVGELHHARRAQIDQSVRGGVQTGGFLLARLEPELRAVRAAIGEAVRAHIAALPPVDVAHPTLMARRDRRPRLTGSWSVRLRGGGYHANHAHPAGWLSSALYLSLPDTDPAEPNAGWLTLGEPPVELGIALEPFQMIQPRLGRLVLFPSTMWHGTQPFAAGERMSIAFDVQFPT